MIGHCHSSEVKDTWIFINYPTHVARAKLLTRVFWLSSRRERYCLPCWFDSSKESFRRSMIFWNLSGIVFAVKMYLRGIWVSATAFRIRITRFTCSASRVGHWSLSCLFEIQTRLTQTKSNGHWSTSKSEGAVYIQVVREDEIDVAVTVIFQCAVRVADVHISFHSLT